VGEEGEVGEVGEVGEKGEVSEVSEVETSTPPTPPTSLTPPTIHLLTYPTNRAHPLGYNPLRPGTTYRSRRCRWRWG
jgi:hypothetical protein